MINITLTDPHNKKAYNTLDQSIFGRLVVTLKKERLFSFLITNKNPKNPEAKGIKSKNNCRFLSKSKFRNISIGSLPGAA